MSDYQQLTRYWNITRIYFNETLFHQRVEGECYFDNWKLGTCFGRIYKDFRPYSTIYQQNGINSTTKFDYQRNAPDCKYEFQEMIFNSEENNIKFDITSRCKTNLVEVEHPSIYFQKAKTNYRGAPL